MKVPEGFELYSVESCAKLYYVIQRGGEKRFYVAKEGQVLHFKFDTESGWPVPTNARQEYKQTIPATLSKKLKQFRKEFFKFAETYWDLIPPPVLDQSSSHSRLLFKDELLALEKESMHALLKFIKNHSYTMKYDYDALTRKSIKIFTLLPLTKELLERWIRRFRIAYYDAHAEDLTYTKVPLGTVARNPTYEKGKRRRMYL
jgi:hypothetical protein